MNRLALFTLLLFITLLVGCQVEEEEAIPNGYFNYEKDQVENAVKELSFQPELPTFLPIATEVVVTDKFELLDSSNEALDISMYTQENDIFTIQLIDGETTKEGPKVEVILLDEQTEAEFVDQIFSKMLMWNKNGVTYKIIYRPNDMNTRNAKVTKEDLVKVAQSFHS
ncbi:hypothetical protein [Saliterribacillus persicus]|uniref:DUF4367 domain-containing protein n=1 Tax=Saliterribacillus persicus TaxID=930114 RepID=A0A368YG54_9BACI|nr:hypothetical protein [Saliterribacillus persicus]RCW77164.1 hypothetical protein DFR57_10131 [Saliterribacillus persicus]